MAEGDSVGKISLDLEVTSDLSNQISKVSNTIGKKLKDTMDGATKSMFNGMSESMNKNMQSMNSTLKSGLDKMKQNIRNTFTSALETLKSIKMPKIEFPKIEDIKPNTNNAVSQPTTRGPPKVINTEALKTEIDSTSKALDITNAKIEQQEAKLARLREEYSTTFNQARKNKLEEQILKTESAINGLISKSDKLGFKLADLDAKFAMAGKGASEAATKINSASNKTGGFTTKLNGVFKGLKNLLSPIRNLGSSAKTTGNHFNGMSHGIGNIARQFATWMIILPLIMKGLEAMTSGLLADLKTNEQFNNSLEQIKTNLMVAFTPIFYAILPAINSLMSALATATTYIASFFSAIFGKTYQQSYQATQGLIDAKKAMGAYGDSAKKAAKDALGLAGIDEINKLSKSGADADNSKVPTLTQPNMDTNEVDSKMQALADKIKNIFGEIFAPMKQAWDSEGKNTIDAFKDALSSILSLVKDIGKSFLDVWTNGTGLKICTDLLKLLQTMFGIVGDIAKAFDIAWNKGGLGTSVVQALGNAFDSILRMLKTIGQVFRDVWNSGIGVEICTNILEILKNIFTIIGQIADAYNRAFQSDIGKQLITDILNLLNGILRNIKDITSSFSKAFESNGDTVVNGILLILDDIVGTISDIANKWSNAWENNGAGDTLMNSLLETLGKLLGTIGDIGKGIRESLGKAADTVFPTLIEFATNLSKGLGNLSDGFKTIWDNGGKTLFDGIVQLIARVGELAMKIAGPVFVDFTETFKKLSPIIGDVAGILGFICQKVADFIGWISQCKPIMEVFKLALESLVPVVFVASAFDTIKNSSKQAADDLKQKWTEGKTYLNQKWDEIKTDAGTKWDEIKTTLGQKWENIKTDSKTTWDNVKKYISDKWEDVKTEASTKWEAIKKTLSDKWGEITKSSSDTWDNIKKYIAQKWGEVNTDAPALWDKIKNTLSGKWNEISTESQKIWNGIVSWLENTFNVDWDNAWKGIVNSFGRIWDGLKDAAKGPINAVIGLINGLISGVNTAIKALNDIDIDIPDWVPGDLGGKSFSMHLKTIGSIPALATGGIIDNPTLAMVGEAGKEAVMPLENNTGWITELATKIAGIMGVNSNSVSTSSGGDGDVIFMLDGEVLGKVAIKQLLKMKRQGIPINL